jgi:hypothetical protein
MHTPAAQSRGLPTLPPPKQPERGETSGLAGDGARNEGRRFGRLPYRLAEGIRIAFRVGLTNDVKPTSDQNQLTATGYFLTRTVINCIQ